MFKSLDMETQKRLIKFALENDASRRRWHITRLSMYRKLKNLLSDFDSPNKKCLCISKSTALAKLLGIRASELVEANYPEFDIIDLPFENSSFDFCVSDQVLEHVEGNPFTAVSECYRAVKPGGIVAHTTCFINAIHGVPKDFWRFTPEALKLLHRQNPGEVIECDGWGNREAWAYISLGFRGEKIPENENNPIFQLALKTEKKWPIVTWIIYRKL
ncbi:MAG TPA: methyltransferase domain-containing protein [Thermohalobaculum sp.]|nr:methyltransferase domain-containing protein [Thermohalobaculum sp.]